MELRRRFWIERITFGIICLWVREPTVFKFEISGRVYKPRKRTGTAISLEAERKGKVGGRSIARDGEGKPGVMSGKQMKELFQPKGYS